MQAALKNLTTGIPLHVVEAAWREAYDTGERIFITSPASGSPFSHDFMTVSEFMLLQAKMRQHNEPPKHIATARPGGVVSPARS